MKIFVGNLASQVNEEELETLFKEYGEVQTVNIIRDMFSRESKGFAFVEMKDKNAAETAIKELNIKKLAVKKLLLMKLARKQIIDVVAAIVEEVAIAIEAAAADTAAAENVGNLFSFKIEYYLSFVCMQFH